MYNCNDLIKNPEVFSGFFIRNGSEMKFYNIQTFVLFPKLFQSINCILILGI